MTEDGLTGRAIALADMVSDMIWGGEQGWESATDEQFKFLLRNARQQMRRDKWDLSQHRVADAFWESWKKNGETHKHGYYESTWIAIRAALDAAGK